MARSQAFNPSNGQCRLCNKEKYFIMFKPEGATLNARSEFYSSCRHKAKHLMGGKTWFVNLKLRTISPAAAPTTQDSSSAETGKGTVHTEQRATEDIENKAKTNGKESSLKEKYKIVKTYNNINLGFMDVTKTVKNFEIHDKENNQVPRVFTPADLS